VKPYKDDLYIVVIVSEPRLVNNARLHATVAFTKDDIYDWQLSEASRNFVTGAYTICASLDLENEDDVAYMTDEGFQCEGTK